MLCRLVLENGSSRDLSTLSSAETLQLQPRFINYSSSKPHEVWIYILALLIAHEQSRAQGNTEAQQAVLVSTGLPVCFPVLGSGADSRKTAFLFSISVVVAVVPTFSRVSSAVQELGYCNTGRVNSECACVDQA